MTGFTASSVTSLHIMYSLCSEKKIFNKLYPRCERAATQ